MNILRTSAGAGLVLALASASGSAQELEISGFVAGDLRIYSDNAIHDGQSDSHLNPSLVVQPEVRYEWNDGDDRISFIPYLRLDPQDHKRTHWDVRELNWLHRADDWDVKIGADKVFWGVAESVHLVDIINQTDAVEDVDGEDKLGQPMINFGLQKDWGDLNFFFMPYFRERTFAGREGRPRGALVVDTDQTTYDSDAEEWNPDLAIRYSTVIGDWDLGLAHFHGTSREPTLRTGTDAGGSAVLLPHYDLIDQTSVDVQATIEEWLWKLEAMTRSGQGDRFFAAVAGLEYTFYGIGGGDGDLGLVAEYQYDGRDADAPAVTSDNDIFLATRFTFNDVDDTDILAGVGFDHENQTTFFSVEADTRLNDNWTIEGEMRIFTNVDDEDPAFGSRSDDHLQIRLARYF